MDNVDSPQSKGHAIVDNVDNLLLGVIVDNVDNLLLGYPHCPQIRGYFGLNWRRARKIYLKTVDIVDNLNCPRLLAPR